MPKSFRRLSSYRRPVRLCCARRFKITVEREPFSLTQSRPMQKAQFGGKEETQDTCVKCGRTPDTLTYENTITGETPEKVFVILKEFLLARVQYRALRRTDAARIAEDGAIEVRNLVTSRPSLGFSRQLRCSAGQLHDGF